MNEVLERIVWIIVAAILGAIFGGAGFLGIMVYYLKRYIDKKLDAEQLASQKCLEYKARRARIAKDMQHAQGRLFYYFYNIIEANHPITDNLRVAFKNLQTVEEDLEQLNQEIVLDFEQKQK